MVLLASGDRTPAGPQGRADRIYRDVDAELNLLRQQLTTEHERIMKATNDKTVEVIDIWEAHALDLKKQIQGGGGVPAELPLRVVGSQGPGSNVISFSGMRSPEMALHTRTTPSCRTK